MFQAQGGGLSFVQSSPQSEDVVVSEEVLAYVDGAHEYVLLNPHGEQASKLSVSGRRDFRNLEDTGEDLYYYTILLSQTAVGVHLKATARLCIRKLKFITA